jgi:uroporphyrinogen III methyltransferase/synthase
MNDGPKKAGIVYLVGAGPGHPGLITRMGYELLQHCDAVAYDALIPLELISSLPERVERHYVGRRAGRHSMPQAEKNRLLLDLALRGLNVVRLKGGDTSFFGGSAEEAEYLAAAGVQVVIIPGVTAASAVAAVSGLPLTDRRAASWAFFATAHGSADEPIPVPWKEIAALSGGTLVIYMGLANLEQTVAKLLEGGSDRNTPCMVVQAATTGVQQILESRLSDVVADCRARQIRPPALVVVGGVVQHRASTFSHATPLAGKRVLTTCCAQETEAVCAALREYGAEPLPYPTYILENSDDAQGWARFATAAASGGWCVFTSSTEVRGFVDALLRNTFDLRSLGKLRIAAFGRDTESALLRRGLRADRIFQIPPQTLSPKYLTGGRSSKAARLVIISEQISVKPEEWADVIRLNLFRTKPASWETHWLQEIRTNSTDFILFDNPAAVDGFVQVLGLDEARSLSGRCKVIVMNNAAAAAASRWNLELSVEFAELFSEMFRT